jgi:hypothetical protein
MDTKTFHIHGGPGPADVVITDPEGRDVTTHFTGLRILSHRDALMTVELEALATCDLKAEASRTREIMIGDLVRDRATAFVGVVTALTLYAQPSTPRVLVEAAADQVRGKEPAAVWFDAGRLIRLDSETASPELARKA